MLAAIWYLEPGSKSNSDRSKGGFTPRYRSLKRKMNNNIKPIKKQKHINVRTNTTNMGL